MSDPRAKLEDLAGAVADGEAVEWDVVESHAAPGPSQHLKALWRMSGRISVDQHPADGTLKASAVGPTLRVPVWLALVLTLAATQILMALVVLVIGLRDTQDVPSFPLIVNMCVFAVAGVALLAGGRRDRRAIHLGALFLVVASALALRFIGRLGPPPATFAWWTRSYPDAFMALLLWLFVRDFPRLGYFTRYDAFARRAIQASGAIAVGLFAANVLRPMAAGRLSGWLLLLSRDDRPSFYWVTQFALMLAALVIAIARTRLATGAERQRVRLFTAGLTLGAAPFLLEVLAENVFPAFRTWMSTPGRRYAGAFVLYGFNALVPAISAYSVLVHKVLEVRVIVVRAIQYALARYTLLGLTAVPFLLFAGYVSRHRDEQVSDLLTSHTAAVAMATLAAGVILLRSRSGLLRWLDRLFLRVRSNPRDALASFGSQVSGALGVREIVSLLAEHMERTLGVERVVVLTLPVARDTFVPLHGRCRPLPVHSAIATVARGSRATLNVDPGDGRSLFRLLPEDERLWTLDAGCSLIVPIRGTDSSFSCLLLLGPKSIDVGFTRDDHAFITSVAAAAGLALENRNIRDLALSSDTAQGGAGDDLAAAECQTCGHVQGWERSACAGCGGPLGPAAVPLDLLGKFKVDAALGRGGMGVVYLATDLVLGRAIALKTLPRLSADAARRLRREARAMAAVTHPNLAVIHGAESWRGTPILIVEYLEGGTLARKLAAGPLPIAEVLAMGATLADALDRIHRAGILHRDIKPSNIGYTRDGVPKLLDFGLARLLDEVGPATAEASSRSFAGAAESVDGHVDSATTAWQGRSYLAGTPLYLSPEAILRRPPDPTFDLWSLGVVLYEAAAGRHPFKGGSIAEIFALISRTSPTVLQGRLTSCPDRVAEFLCRMLARDRPHRPARASEMRLEIRELQKTLEPVQAPAPGAEPRAY